MSRLGKIDLNDETNKPIGSKFGVRGYPTLKIFRNGEATPYDGPRDAAGIVAFLKAERTKVRYTCRTNPMDVFSMADQIGVAPCRCFGANERPGLTHLHDT